MMRLRYLLPALVLAAAGMLAPVMAKRLPSPEEVAGSISTHEVKFHLHYLASQKLAGRRTATEGERRAGDYIAAELQRYGVSPGGTKKTYFQSFPVASGRKITTAKLTFRTHNQTIVFKRGTDFDVYGYSSSESFKGDVVFAGYGTRGRGHNDYKGLKVKDKIVVVLNNPPKKTTNRTYRSRNSVRFKAMMARHMGAKAIMVIVPQVGKKQYRFMSVPGRRTLNLPVIYLNQASAAGLFKYNGMDLDAIIKSTKRPQGRVLKNTVEGEIKIKSIISQARNVVGFLPGSHPQLKKEIVVIGAHYDHLGRGGPGSRRPGSQDIHYGADDNASGTSALLEVAEALALVKGTLRRSYLFIAFSGEEMGLLGSAHFVKHPTFNVKNIVTMLNMDMVGRLRSNKLYVMGGGTATEFMPMLKTINNLSGMGFALQTASKGGIGPSDHTSFYRKKIPVLHFFTGLHKEYHTPSDVISTVNYPGTARIAQFVFYTAMYVDALEKKPEYQFVRTRRRGMRRGRTAYLGIIPEYGSSTKGLRISGTSAGGPADRGGLKGGDVIVQMGKVKVKNIYDLMHALRTYKNGQTVVITVVRKGKKVNLKVTLGRK